MDPAETHRLDTRIDAETDARIGQAAALLHVAYFIHDRGYRTATAPTGAERQPV